MDIVGGEIHDARPSDLSRIDPGVIFGRCGQGRILTDVSDRLTNPRLEPRL